jgi:hypothetical protein
MKTDRRGGPITTLDEEKEFLEKDLYDALRWLSVDSIPTIG